MELVGLGNNKTLTNCAQFLSCMPNILGNLGYNTWTRYPT
jgi:hypothetical protein